MQSAIFWDITQRIVIFPYRRFGTTYRSHLQRSRNFDLELPPYSTYVPEDRRSLQVKRCESKVESTFLCNRIVHWSTDIYFYCHIDTIDIWYLYCHIDTIDIWYFYCHIDTIYIWYFYCHIDTIDIWYFSRVKASGRGDDHSFYRCGRVWVELYF
jgi:hypothetical protein